MATIFWIKYVQLLPPGMKLSIREDGFRSLGDVWHYIFSELGVVVAMCEDHLQA
jgi:hypothetical protein